jgi:hypothetical protein
MCLDPVMQNLLPEAKIRIELYLSKGEKDTSDLSNHLFLVVELEMFFRREQNDCFLLFFFKSTETCIYIQVHLVVYLTLSFIFFFIKKRNKVIA